MNSSSFGHFKAWNTFLDEINLLNRCWQEENKFHSNIDSSEKNENYFPKLSKRSVDGRGREYKLCAHHFLSLLGEEEVLVGGGNILHLSKIFSDF